MAGIECKTVYVVDDEPVHLSMMQFMLRRIGFAQVRIFTDAISAYERMESEKPDLIISDWNMDPVDGLELLKMVRKNGSTTSVPFIMVTANASEQYWRDAIAAGATEFLFKPLRLDIFRDAVMIALEIADGMSNLRQLELRSAELSNKACEAGTI